MTNRPIHTLSENCGACADKARVIEAIQQDTELNALAESATTEFMHDCQDMLNWWGFNEEILAQLYISRFGVFPQIAPNVLMQLVNVMVTLLGMAKGLERVRDALPPAWDAENAKIN